MALRASLLPTDRNGLGRSSITSMEHGMLLNIHRQTVASWVTTLVAVFFILGFVAGVASGMGAQWAVLAAAAVILGTQMLLARKGSQIRPAIAAAR
tara:strand:+ start:757 stop:1044 length:288 start_codon:yes stop_codon:yes gene_type:complete